MKRSPMPTKRKGKRRRLDADGLPVIQLTGKARSAHMDAVAALGCIACMMDGNAGTPAELHHIRETAGGGQKALDTEIISLCRWHHEGDDHPHTPSIHRDRLAFIERYGSEIELLARVRVLLGDE